MEDINAGNNQDDSNSHSVTLDQNSATLAQLQKVIATNISHHYFSYLLFISPIILILISLDYFLHNFFLPSFFLTHISFSIFSMTLRHLFLYIVFFSLIPGGYVNHLVTTRN
jgi:hypothetical protein